MMHRSPDAEVLLRLTSALTGGKDRAVMSGYRPIYAICDDYLTSVNHELIETDQIAPGTQGRANIWFITPDVYPLTLWPGREIAVLEGSRQVGVAIIVRILNPLLLADHA